MTFFKLKLKDEIKGLASRSNAIEVRNKILLLLQKYDTVEIDLEDSNLTPSVADEIIGELDKKFGAEHFKQKIKIQNASDSDMALMKHVIAHKLYGDR